MKIKGEINGIVFLQENLSNTEVREDELEIKLKELRQYGDYEHIMLTKFGNIIRAFEHYPKVMYNIDSIAVWPHMMYILPNGQKSELNDIKSQVDFAVHILYISVILMLGYIVLSSYTKTIPIWGILVLLMIITFLAYRLAISSSIQWGFYVKAIFDIYRHDLLRKMGIKVPQTWDEERRIWDKISQSFIYWYKIEDDETPRNE
jgi:hypothetical protein